MGDRRERRDTPVRIPKVLLARADALVEPLENHLELLGWSRPNRAAVVRLALARGLDSLEKELLEGNGDD